MIHRVGAKARPHPIVPHPPEPLELGACYRYCEALAHAHHHNFPVASLFVPSRLRQHIFSIYAFARTADDFADEASFEGRRVAELDRWDERLHACYHDEPIDHPVFMALSETITRFNLPITEFSALMQGFRADLEVRRHATFTDLRAYTALSAEPIGHLLLYLGGYRDPVLHRYADALSTGLALAKLWQDIPGDIARGRIYVPGEDLVHFGVDESVLETRGASEELGALIRYEVARTRALFVRAKPLVDAVGPELGIELALIWLGGMQILGKIESSGRHVLRRRPTLHAVDKAEVVSRALAWRGRTLGWRGRSFVRRVLG